MVGIHRTRNMAERYSIFSQNRPHTAAAFTASAILGAADVSSQFLQHWIPQRRRLLGAETKFCRDMSIDWRRTAGLTTFGFIHYGGACKWLYLWYDRLLGTAPTLRNAAAKMVFDVYVHSPFLLVRSIASTSSPDSSGGQDLAFIVCSLKLLRRQRFLSKPFCSRLKAQQAKAFNHRSD